MPETSLVVVDPGHFHATLVQSDVRVWRRVGPENRPAVPEEQIYRA